MTICAHCRHPINREHEWLRIDAGAQLGNTRITRDRNYCSTGCLARHLTAEAIAEEAQTPSDTRAPLSPQEIVAR